MGQFIIFRNPGVVLIIYYFSCFGNDGLSTASNLYVVHKTTYLSVSLCAQNIQDQPYNFFLLVSTSPIILRRFNFKICNIQNSEKKSVTETFTNGYGSTGKLGEQNCSSWREVFTVENLHEVFKGFSSGIVVSSGRFPISQAIFFHLLRVFRASQMQDHFYVYEFREGPCIRVLNIN